MTDLLLALVTDYGLYIITSIIFIAALGIPLPSSIIALTSGGLAATGDLVLEEVLIAIFIAYAIGDQVAYTLGGRIKPESLDSLRTSRRIGSLVQRCENYYHKNGLLAVLLSRTVMSSIGPYMAYFCGALRMRRSRFSVTALIGVAIWTLTYVMLGYTFAGNLPQMSNLVAGFLMAGVAAFFTLGFATKLILAWRKLEVV